MRKFLVLATLLLVFFILLAPAPREAQAQGHGGEGECQAPCYLINAYTNELGQLCITSYCICTNETTTDCRDPE